MNSQKKQNYLELEIIEFTKSLSYWEKYLAERILSGLTIKDIDIKTAYSFLLEDVAIQEHVIRPELNIKTFNFNISSFVDNLSLVKIHKIEGVNALAENQEIEFSPQLTILYGANGAGKSSYSRLFKKACFARANEEIVPNIHLVSNKPISAEFVFSVNGQTIPVNYPQGKERAEFQQFAVFDNKCASVHLNEKNEFEFKPSGLKFFSELIRAYKQVETKFLTEIQNNNIKKDYASLFDGDSDIKKLIQDINAKMEIEKLKDHLPYSNEDREKKRQLEERKANLQILKKDKEIKDLEEIKKLLETLKSNIVTHNVFFSVEKLADIREAITSYIQKENRAKQEGIQSFESNTAKDIGSPEWKEFIEAAHNFAQQQSTQEYPETGDSCLLCLQPLDEEAKNLIVRYWVFIKSQVETEAKSAKLVLDGLIKQYEGIILDFVPENSILEKWLINNCSETLKLLRINLSNQKKLRERIIKDIATLNSFEWEQYGIDLSGVSSLIISISKKIQEIRDKEPILEISLLNAEINYLNHKEKLVEHMQSIEDYIKLLKWVEVASTAKRKISTKKLTEKEKELSEKYFNKAYYSAFQEECIQLDGSFGIDIKHTGSLGNSYRELKIKGRIPSEILSEGEQKVISLADFLSEMRLSEINKGIIFDDPVNSLDDERKSNIAERLVKEAKERQVVIFTHDLVFVSCLHGSCEDYNVKYECHWIERNNGKPGNVWLKNTPSFEKSYKKTGKAQTFYDEASRCGPEDRETKIKNGFAALRTSYEALVVFDLFNGVVQRFNERVSIDSLPKVYFNEIICNEITDGFYQCCRYMEGHSHSDRYGYKKPTVNNLNEEIQRFNEVRRKLNDLKKQNGIS